MSKHVRAGRNAVCRAAIAFVILVSVGGSVARAQCVPFDERSSLEERETFLNDPAYLLRMARNDNSKIESNLASYLASDPGLLPAVRKLVALAPSSSKRSIGAGIRRAESLCTAPKPEVARKLIDFVRNLGDPEVYSGYVSSSEEPTPSYAARKTAAPQQRTKPFSGEWNNEISDPFASVPLPQ